MRVGGDGVVMLGDPGPDYRCPKRTGQTTQSIHVYVDDVEAHFAHAREAGASIVSEPKDQPYGDRRYRVADLEGHEWMFAQHIRDVPTAEWGAQLA